VQMYRDLLKCRNWGPDWWTGGGCGDRIVVTCSCVARCACCLLYAYWVANNVLSESEAVKACRRVEVQLQLFLTLHYVEVSGNLHGQACLPPGKAPLVFD